MIEDLENQRQNFKDFMKVNNLTAYSWAKKAGITEGAIRSYISGRSSSLNYNTLYKLAAVVNVTPKEIVDPDKASNKKMFDDQKYLEKNLFLNCVEKVNSIIDENNLQLSSKERQKLYIAWYNLKLSSKNNKDDPEQDNNSIEAILRLVI